MRFASGLCALSIIFMLFPYQQELIPAVTNLTPPVSQTTYAKHKPADERQLELLIFNETLPASNLDNGTSIRAYRSDLLQANLRWSLADTPRIRAGILPQQLSIGVQTEQGKKTIQLPQPLEKKLLSYLTFGPASQPFDCGSFVHYLYGISYIPGEFEKSLWQANLLRDESELKPGEVVAVSERDIADRRSIVHFALALGDGLYLSKFGTLGSLIVTDLSALQHTFEGEYVFTLKARGQSQI